MKDLFGSAKFKYGLVAVVLIMLYSIFLHLTKTDGKIVVKPFNGKLAGFRKPQDPMKTKKVKDTAKTQEMKKTSNPLLKDSRVYYQTADLKKRLDKWEKLRSVAKTEPRVSRLCDSIVIGVRKCGTAALLQFLGNHPLVRIPEDEVHYYDQGVHLEKGLDHYKSLLPNASSKEVLMEKTPAYFLSYPEDLPSIIERDSPGVKAIVTLCDPVNRVLSEYARLIFQNKTAGIAETFDQFIQENFGPTEKFYQDFNVKNHRLGLNSTLKKWEAKAQLRHEKEETFLFRRGIYIYNVMRWMKEFGPDRFLIVDGSQLLNDPGSVIEQVQTFLNIPVLLKRKDFIRNPVTGLFCVHRWWSDTQSKIIRNIKEATYEYKFRGGSSHCLGKEKGRTRKNDTGYSMSDAVKKRLQKFYRPFNKELFTFLNRTFDWIF